MITGKNIERTFVSGDIENHVLKGISLVIKDGEFVSIMGRSGAGKSTLLYQLGLLDRPTVGEVYLEKKGHDLAVATSNERAEYRLNNLGYVFQYYALLPDLTALENVSITLMMLGIPKSEAYAAGKKALDKVGMTEHYNKVPSQLSGGEQQRVSIARAVVNDPSILFADEPTANLDSGNAEGVMDVFEELHHQGQTIVMVTHERQYAKRSGRIITLDDGKIVKDEKLHSKH